MILFGALLISSCSSASSQDSPAAAVQDYLHALQAKDLNKMINLSCAAWESQAKLEYDSFGAVQITIEDLACQSGDQAGESTLVSCNGRIVASYGAEDLIIELNERAYETVREGGEWRMCGYQ